jgi:hypothetical protein
MPTRYKMEVKPLLDLSQLWTGRIWERLYPKMQKDPSCSRMGSLLTPEIMQYI